jgi:DNA-binding LacI/PurR family transcriptional regulator
MIPISSTRLARLCRVSQGTVDRALHGRGRIAPATRLRIVNAAKRLGYLPHPAARELLTGTSSFVGAIVPSVNNLFFMDIMDLLSAALRPLGLRLLIAPASDSDEAHELIREFAGRRVRSIIVAPSEADFVVEPSIRRSHAVISIINRCASSGVRFAGPSEAHTGERAVRFLAGQGHRRIMHASYARRSWAIVERERGYRRAMADLGARPCIVDGKDEKALWAGVLKYKPTAIFCHNDWLALSTIQLLTRKGLRVPGDISVMGVDNSSTFVRLYPGLTTMQYPFKEIVASVTASIAGNRTIPAVADCRVVEGKTVTRVTGPR